MNKKMFALSIIGLLTLSVLCVFSFSLVKANISDAKIVSYNSYLAPSNTVASSSGDLIVVGEVQNTGSTNLGYAIVAGTAYNSTGDLLDSAEAQISATDLLPGQKAPFYLDFTADNSATGDLIWTSYVSNITLFVESAPSTTESQYSGLTISSPTPTQSNGYSVTGSVQNTGTQTTGEVWGVATFYNSSGSVISLGISPLLTQTLAPGSSVSFTVAPIEDFGASSQISNYSLLIQTAPVQTTPSTSPSIEPTSSPTPNTSTSTTPTSSPSSPSSLFSNPTTTIVVALSVVVVAVIIVSILIYKHQRSRRPASENPHPQSPQVQPPAPPESTPPAPSLQTTQ